MWTAVRWLHELAMAFFVGGQLVLAAAVVPALRATGDRAGLRAVARRFGWGTLAALGVLAVTGAALASHLGAWGRGTLHVKLALIAALGVLVVWHMRRAHLHALEGAIFAASLTVVALGVALAH